MKQTKSFEIDMCNGTLMDKLISFSIPLMLSGILQLIFEENDCGAENFAKAEKLRSEFVVAVEGRVEARSGAVNENLATGAIEIRANSLRILLSLRHRHSLLRRRARQRKSCVWSTVSLI